MNSTPRQRLTKRLTSLDTERNSWLEHWRELSQYIQPRRGQFLSNDVNKGWKRNDKLINNTPTIAARTQAAGMMAGISSPSRPWFRLTTPDPDLAEFGPVRGWLHTVEERLRTGFLASNIYLKLHETYEDLGIFGTAVMLVEEGPRGLHSYVIPAGQYFLASDARQQINTLYRKLQMTVGQLAEQFGLNRCSDNVKNRYREGHLDAWVEVVHVIEPNLNLELGKADKRGKPWRSVWFELQGDERAGFLRESGYESFPVMAPRWHASGSDIYGRSPGMEALGDCRAIQLLERRAAQAADKVIDPPMRGPTSMMNRNASLLPGAVNYADVASGGQKFEPAMELRAEAISIFELKIREHERRINSAFFADLWLMMAQSDRRQMTAREVAERHEEKMHQLGPVLERLNGELLRPLIDRAFDILMRAGHIPPPPEEIQGVDLGVEYLSPMAQAQKLLGITAVDRFVGMGTAIAGVSPSILDKYNLDEVVDSYADMLGIPPDLVRADEEVAQMRQARAAAQQAAAQAQQTLQAAQSAKVLSETNTEEDNGLTRMLGAFGAVQPGGAA